MGEVYHLSLIAVGPRRGTEQFSAFISAALEKNPGAAFSSEAIFLHVFYLLELLLHCLLDSLARFKAEAAIG